MKMDLHRGTLQIVGSFTVGLLCRPNDLEEDVALLLTVNFQDRSIIRNAKFAGIWGAEERKKKFHISHSLLEKTLRCAYIYYMPLTMLGLLDKACSFSLQMEIVCQHRQMQVFLDGQRLCDFTHRVPQLKAVTGLRVIGDIKLTKVA
ncbi:unnamed protein product [Ranitomeya imitator]|uniref:Galectin n=1 Tax=Ranitomeya imitator TaxID=111125 RepID=A0ABN9LAN1_9NEOB|nr:unnamed protein product [Ranitomeya imitator]